MRDFSAARRIVVKIGTNVLTKDGGVDLDYVADVARQAKALVDAGKQPLIVTSGAIGMGARELGLDKRPTEVPMRQACAAIGQPMLMQAYRAAFHARGLKVAQVLITADTLSSRESYLNLRNAVDEMLALGVVPVFNENDVVSTDEIGNAFGDNDRLSAYIASKVDAELLIILTDIDALYDSDPRTNPGARPLSRVDGITKEVMEMAGAAGTRFSTGGMRTKILAVRIAEKAGCPVLLAHGREEDVLERLVAGEEIGTWFVPKARMRSRLRWVMNSVPAGELSVDEGAMEALRAKRSLLPAGVRAVTGHFGAGEVIGVNGKLKLVTRLSSAEIRLAMGKGAKEAEALLGKKDLIARPEDMVFLEEE